MSGIRMHCFILRKVRFIRFILICGAPAGKLEKNETPLSAFQRELGEEAGVRLISTPTFLRTVFVEHFVGPFTYHVFYTELKGLPEVRVDNSEHVERAWLSFEEIISRELIPDELECLKIFRNVIAI